MFYQVHDLTIIRVLKRKRDIVPVPYRNFDMVVVCVGHLVLQTKLMDPAVIHESVQRVERTLCFDG